MNNRTTISTAPFHKTLYLLFILFTVFQYFTKHSYFDSAASVGITLAFDPFNTQQSWNERPHWQKIWLYVHLIIVVLLFILGFSFTAK